MGIFSGAKDKLIASTLPTVLNRSYLQPYGRIIDFQINTAAKSVEIELELKGETQPVRVNVQEFEIAEQNGKTVVRLKKIATSREWLTRVANDFLIGRPIALPAEAARAIKSVF